MRYFLLAGVIAALVIAALDPGEFYLGFLTRVMILAILATGLNILVGHGGLLSLAHSAFFGIAAYGIGWMTINGWNPLLAIGASLAISLAAAAVLGALSLRTTGIAFLMITLALGQVVWGLAYRWVNVTGGDNGLTGIRRPQLFGLSLDSPVAFFLLCAVVFLACVATISAYLKSPFGKSLRGTRDQARRMSALGFDVWMIRWIAFITAGFFAAVAGILDAYYVGFVSPASLSLFQATIVLLAIIIGGAPTILGPVAGSFVILGFSDFFSSLVPSWHAVLGLFLLVIVIFMPRGVGPWLSETGARLRARGNAARLRTRSDATEQQN